MITTKWKLATVLGIAGALALSIASAEARPMHHAAHVARDAYGYQPSSHNAYGWINDGVGRDGTGTYSDGRRVPGTNWNPNQN
jgi:hypothetical protein